MIALAYLYAEGEEEGEIPGDLRLAYAIQHYGAQAVLGRTLTAKEIRRMSIVENIVTWFRERTRAEDWAAWSRDNPKKARALETAAEIAREYEQ